MTAKRQRAGESKRSTYDTISGRFLLVPRDEALCEPLPSANCLLPDSAPDESPSGLCTGSALLPGTAAVFGIVISRGSQSTSRRRRHPIPDRPIDRKEQRSAGEKTRRRISAAIETETAESTEDGAGGGENNGGSCAPYGSPGHSFSVRQQETPQNACSPPCASPDAVSPWLSATRRWLGGLGDDCPEPCPHREHAQLRRPSRSHGARQARTCFRVIGSALRRSFIYIPRPLPFLRLLLTHQASSHRWDCLLSLLGTCYVSIAAVLESSPSCDRTCENGVDRDIPRY